MATNLSHAPGWGGVSFEDFLTAYDDQHAEWVAGTVVPMSPASDRHQDVVGFLHTLLRVYLRARSLGVVRAGPFVMRVGEAAREPDLVVLHTEHEDRIMPGYLDGPADLVVEVISPDSRVRDRGEKYYEYELAGVREYWLIDPIRERVEQYRLDARGKYESVPLGDPPTLKSDSFPGVQVQVEWLWSHPLPDEMEVLKGWGVG